MTPEKQRIAIAEACGWDSVETLHALPYRLPPSGDRSCPVLLPDYLNDLNAMHEAEKAMSIDDRNFYIDMLGMTYHDSWEFCRATAAQRAEAFLRTIGKWEDEQ